MRDAHKNGDAAYDDGASAVQRQEFRGSPNYVFCP